jgi:hypothetical protein
MSATGLGGEKDGERLLMDIAIKEKWDTVCGREGVRETGGGMEKGWW